MTKKVHKFKSVYNKSTDPLALARKEMHDMLDQDVKELKEKFIKLRAEKSKTA